jgi:hypothetical protein
MKTDPQTILRFLTEARNCAMQMMQNGSYILNELPPLRMTDALRKKIEALCISLIDSKHDLIHEIFEIDELVTSTPESPAITEGIERMRQWIFMATMSFHDCVKDVQRAVELGEADGLLSLLLTESAVNILNMVPSAPEGE